MFSPHVELWVIMKNLCPSKDGCRPKLEYVVSKKGNWKELAVLLKNRLNVTDGMEVGRTSTCRGNCRSFLGTPGAPKA